MPPSLIPFFEEDYNVFVLAQQHDTHKADVFFPIAEGRAKKRDGSVVKYRMSAKGNKKCSNHCISRERR
jgi:hypothetical protein